nr:tissue kallikrein-related proteinase (EC 3.4.21.-) S3 - rat (fragments) [Rattus norvegicus]
VVGGYNCETNSQPWQVAAYDHNNDLMLLHLSKPADIT